MSMPSRRARWLVPVVLLLIWLGIGGTLGPYAGKLGEVATNDQAAFLPRSAESTRVVDAQKAFQQDETPPGDRRVDRGRRRRRHRTPGGGHPVGRGPRRAARDRRSRDARPALRRRRGPPSRRPGQPDLGDRLPDVLERIGDAAGQVAGTQAQLAGPAASQADLSDAFAGIDGLLLGVALVTVLVILLLVYRSVLLPLVIILGAVFALGLACAIVYALADRDVVRVDGQVQGILSILVIGAATDYALLLTARYREELARHPDRFSAVRAALRASWGAVVASAATVALGLLALLLSDLTNNRALGPVGAIGIVCAVLSTLTFPARRPGPARPGRLPGRPSPSGPAIRTPGTACGTASPDSWTGPRAASGRSPSRRCWPAPRSRRP